MRFGVDVGGTTVKIGVLDNYEIIDTFVVVTKKETLFDDVLKGIKDYCDNKNITPDVIGFGIPGTVKNNYIVRMPNVGIGDIDLRKETDKYFPNVEIASTNDANAAALGEVLFDKNEGSGYMVTLGTGVGGGYISGGKVIDGAHCACGEIGHMKTDFIHNYKCNCGLSGCLETVSSATGVVRLAKEYITNKKYETKLVCDNLSCKDVFDAAKENDPLALKVVDEVASYIAHGLSIVAVVVDVDRFYIGGGVAAGGNILLDRVKMYFNEYSYFAVKDTEIKFAELGNKAGMLGAAYIK